MLRSALALSLALCLGACSSTTAGRVSRPGAGFATVIPETQMNRQRAAGIFSAPCRGGEVKLRVNGCRVGGDGTFTVPAGPQQLQVAYMNVETPDGEKVLRTKAVILPLTVQAGRTYGIRGRVDWRGQVPTVRFWAVDGSTGETVSSVIVPQANVLWDYPDIF